VAYFFWATLYIWVKYDKAFGSC